MTLTLRAVSLNDLPLTQPITAEFGPQGGTIGRADGNTLALPDPERHISRQQAEIRASGTGYVILNIGSANPITVGGQSLAQGQSLPVRDRDEIRVGGYLLEVTISAADDTNMMLAGRPAEGGQPFASPVQRAPQTAPPHAAPLPASDPFADLLGGGGGKSAGGGSLGSGSGSGSGGNPFADLLGAPPPPAPRPARAVSTQ